MATKKVYVSRVQRDAAKRIVARSAATGRYVSSAVSKVAGAESPSRSRSAVTGRYVTPATSTHHPKQTQTESSS